MGTPLISQIFEITMKRKKDTEAEMLTVLRDQTNRVAENVAKGQTKIMFDLETTGLSRLKHEIVEIACWVVSDVPNHYSNSFESRPDVFHSLVYPTKAMNPMASNINGITRAGKHDLLVRGVRHCNVRSAHDVLTDLIEWLRRFPQPVLIAHNGFRFDAPFLIAAMMRNKLYDDFNETVAYFGDTIPELKEVLPLQQLKLTVLGEQFIPNWRKYQNNAHSALFDVWATIKVMTRTRAVYSASRFRETQSLIPKTLLKAVPKPKAKVKPPTKPKATAKPKTKPKPKLKSKQKTVLNREPITISDSD